MENRDVPFLYEITEGNGKEDGFTMKRYETNLKLYMYKKKDSVFDAVFYLYC